MTRLKKYKAVIWVQSSMAESEIMKKIYDGATGIFSKEERFRVSRITKVKRVD